MLAEGVRNTDAARLAMTEISTPAPVSRAFLENSRKDAWWPGPTATAVGLLAFVVYSTWAALVGAHYEWGPYLSPMYSPLIPTGWLPLPEPLRKLVSPALLILWAPGGFRVTCYYYRKAYYRALF